MTGQRFGRVLVLGPGGRQGTTPRWRCVCDCGRELFVQGASLRTGRQQSCGCLKSETAATLHRKHGLTASPEARIWSTMKQRCMNPNNASFSEYGGRGIRVCDRWADSFESFLADMGPRPSPRHSIDRIKNDKGYEPANCRWATRSEQNSNTRRNVFVFDGAETVTLTEWARRRGVHVMTAWHRYQRGRLPGPSTPHSID